MSKDFEKALGVLAIGLLFASFVAKKGTETPISAPASTPAATNQALINYIPASENEVYESEGASFIGKALDNFFSITLRNSPLTLEGNIQGHSPLTPDMKWANFHVKDVSSTLGTDYYFDTKLSVLSMFPQFAGYF